MNERYSRIFTLSNSVYTPHCPIIIISGALSKDNKSGNLIGQFKFLNASNKVIKEIGIDISYCDATEQLLEAAVPFKYTDLQVTPGELFGQKTPIPILNPATRIISAKIKNIVFSNNDELLVKEQEIKTVPIQQELHELLGKELSLQYVKDISNKAKYVPITFDGFGVARVEQLIQ